MSELLDRLDKKIAALTADIDRVESDARRQVTELRANKAALTEIRQTLASRPEYEALLSQAKAQGLL